MSWSTCLSIMQQLARLVPRPRRFRSWTGMTSLGSPQAGFGCCPACHEFIRIEPAGPRREATCPACGRAIRSLDPLGSERSLGATDEL